MKVYNNTNIFLASEVLPKGWQNLHSVAKRMTNRVDEQLSNDEQQKRNFEMSKLILKTYFITPNAYPIKSTLSNAIYIRMDPNGL